MSSQPPIAPSSGTVLGSIGRHGSVVLVEEAITESGGSRGGGYGHLGLAVRGRTSGPAGTQLFSEPSYTATTSRCPSGHAPPTHLASHLAPTAVLSATCPLFASSVVVDMFIMDLNKPSGLRIQQLRQLAR